MDDDPKVTGSSCKQNEGQEMKTHSDDLTQRGRLLSHKYVVFKSLGLNVNIIDYSKSSLV